MIIPFKQARYFFSPQAPRKIDLVVVHCADVLPRSGEADWLMKYCADEDRMASWHYAVDDVGVTQSVREADVAYQAAGANRNGIGIELATLMRPSAAQWSDVYHQKMLVLAAWLAAGVCARWKIDPFFVDAAGLVEGRRGITTHAEVSLAWPEKASKPPHTDPGPDFPTADFLAKVKARIDAGNFQLEENGGNNG